MLVNDFRKVAVFAGMFGAFLRRVGVKFGALGGYVFIEAFRLLFSEGRLHDNAIFRGGDFFRFGSVFVGEVLLGDGVEFFLFCAFLFVLFIEFGATGNRVNLGVFGSFLMLGFDQFGSKSSGLVFAQFGIDTNRFRDAWGRRP